MRGQRGGKLVFLGLLALAGWVQLTATILASEQEKPKVLMFTKSSGFQHSVVARGPKGELGLAERTLRELAEKHGFDVNITKDGSQIHAAGLKKYQAVLFFTQGNLTVPGVDKQTPMKADDRQAILEFVRAGGGFVGTHCGGADTFHEWNDKGRKPFLEMVGGEFIGHGPQQVTSVEVVDPQFPAVKMWPNAFTLNDEWYAYKEFQPNIRVLMMIHTKGMKNNLYERPNYPITWCSNYGNGRVFYTGIGHREDVWTNPRYQQMVATAVLWSLKKVDADATPNLKELFGDVETGLKRINPARR